MATGDWSSDVGSADLEGEVSRTWGRGGGKQDLVERYLPCSPLSRRVRWAEGCRLRVVPLVGRDSEERPESVRGRDEGDGLEG